MPTEAKKASKFIDVFYICLTFATALMVFGVVTRFHNGQDPAPFAATLAFLLPSLYIFTRLVAKGMELDYQAIKE